MKVKKRVDGSSPCLKAVVSAVIDFDESLDVRETCELGWKINEFAYQNKPKEKIERRARVALEKANGSV